LLNEKIFVLCAQEGTVDIFNTKTNKVEEKIQLDKKGFYSNLTKIPNQNNLMITGYNTNQFLILDCDKQKVTNKRDLEVQVSNLIIIDK